MALTLTSRITSLSGTGTGHGTGPYALSSFTPSDNSLLCVVVMAMDTTGATMAGADLTISDSLGSTWTSRVNTSAAPTWAYGGRAWTTPITTGAPITISIDCGAYEIRDYVVWVFDVTGYDTGSPIAGAIAGSDSDGDGAGSLTLGATPTADDLAIAAVMVQTGGTGAITHGTGWTEAYETGEADWCRAQFQSRTGSTSTAVAWDDLSAGGSPFDAVMLAFIVKNAAGPSAEIDQDAFRFYNDDGSESTATASKAQNTNDNVALDVARTVRFLLQGTGDAPSSAFKLKAQKNGSGGYADVPVGLPAAPSVTWGAIGTGGAGTNSCTPTYPTGISASTSELFACVTGRSNTASTAFSAPSGWTLVSSSELEGGTGTFAADTGTRRVAWFKKDTVSGSETGTETFAYASGSSGNSTIYASIVRVEKPIGHSISVAATTGADTTNGTGYSATGSAGLSFLADDLLLLGTAQNLDTGTQSSEAISATDVTFGTLSNRRSTAVTNGFDQRHIIVSRPVTSVTGTPTSAPTYSYTISASGSGPTSFLRLRSVAPTVELYIATSSNITAGGEASTNRLTGGSGSFVTGRIWDDENGADSIDLTEDDFTEVAWNLKVQAPADDGDYFDLRVYAGDSALSAYAQTPRLSVGTPAPAITDVDTDETVLEGQTSVAVSGSDFGDDETDRTFTLRQGSNSVPQTETGSGTSAAAALTIVIEQSGADIKFGAATLRCTRSADSLYGELAVTVLPPSGQLYVDIGTPDSEADNRITATGDIASGDQLQARGVGGGAAPAGLQINADGTFEFEIGETPAAFDVRVWDTSDSTWGGWATQGIAGDGIDAGVDALIITERTAAVRLSKAISATLDALAITERAATVRLSRNIAAGVDTLAITERSATVRLSRNIAAATDALMISEQGATIRLAKVIAATVDALIVTERAATVGTGSGIAAGVDALLLTERTAAVNRGRNIAASLDALSITERVATVRLAKAIATSLDALVITERNASVSTGMAISAAVDALLITERVATISAGSAIAAGVDTLSLTERSASAKLSRNVQASADALLITEHASLVRIAKLIAALQDSLVITEHPASIQAQSAIVNTVAQRIVRVAARASTVRVSARPSSRVH